MFIDTYVDKNIPQRFGKADRSPFRGRSMYSDGTGTVVNWTPHCQKLQSVHWSSVVIQSPLMPKISFRKTSWLDKYRVRELFSRYWRSLRPPLVLRAAERDDTQIPKIIRIKACQLMTAQRLQKIDMQVALATLTDVKEVCKYQSSILVKGLRIPLKELRM